VVVVFRADGHIKWIFHVSQNRDGTSMKESQNREREIGTGDDNSDIDKDLDFENKNEKG
jgi:hypothetical protein